MQGLDSSDASLSTSKSEIENTTFTGCDIEDSVSCDANIVGSIFRDSLGKTQQLVPSTTKGLCIFFVLRRSFTSS